MTDTSQLRTLMSQETERCEPAESSPVNAHAESQTTDVEDEFRTPLPRFQLFIALLIQFAEPITGLVIYPFVNQFVRDTGITQGDDKKTGYYAGVIESAFFFAEAATVFQWGWLSDRFGRRPVLLLGPLGLTLAMLKFGYSTTFWSMVFSRCMQGIFNGNIGVAKTVMVELTDSTNVGDAFAMMPLMWIAGTTVAPILGGVLSNPATRWPNVFGRIVLLREHPYLLPCLVASTLAFSTFVIGFLGLKETHPSFSRSLANDKKREQDLEILSTDSTDTLLSHNDTPDYGTTTSTRCSSSAESESSVDSFQKLADPSPESVTLHSLLKSRRMQFIIINYVFISFADMCYVVLVPLIFSTSIQSGGLGMTPYQIGLTLGIYGLINAFVQVKLFGKLIRKYGGPSVYRVTYACQLVSLMTLPFSAYLARRNGSVGIGSCAIILIQLFFQFFSNMTYGAIHIVIAESAPKSVLGSINGIVQMTGGMTRTITPAFASSLFSISIEGQILGGYFVYVIIYFIVLVGIGFSGHLTSQKCKRVSA